MAEQVLSNEEHQLQRDFSGENNQSFMLLHGEDSMSNLSLEHSVDRLIPFSAQISTNSSQKDDLQSQQSNPVPPQQPQGEQPSQHQQEGARVEKKSFYWTFFKNDENKSSIRLYLEMFGCGFFSEVWRKLGKMNENKGDQMKKELKEIQTSIDLYKDKNKEFSFSRFEDTPIGEDVIIYGKVNQYISPMNESNGFDTKQGYRQVKIEFQPSYNHREVQVTLLNGKQYGAQSVSVERRQKNGSTRLALASAALVSGSAAEWLSLKFDSDFSIERGENVFILGKRLYNQSLIPTFIFKKFDLSKYTTPLRALALKSFIFKALLVATTVMSIKKLYSICKRQLQGEK